jgi:hypothetical protein
MPAKDVPSGHEPAKPQGNWLLTPSWPSETPGQSWATILLQPYPV